MLIETIYATHNIFDLDKLHCNLRRIMRRALVTKVLGRWWRRRWWKQCGGRITVVLIITYLSETKACLCDDNICFQNERYKLSNNNPSGFPEGYYAKSADSFKTYRQTIMFSNTRWLNTTFPIVNPSTYLLEHVQYEHAHAHKIYILPKNQPKKQNMYKEIEYVVKRIYKKKQITKYYYTTIIGM